MRVGNFCLIIPEGSEKDSGHIMMSHGQQYTIQLRNQWNDRACDVELTIDGKDEGGWRVHANGNMTLERPAHDHGRFTFYRSASEQASTAGAACVENADRGLIVARFKPEHRRSRAKVLNASNVMRGAGGQSCRPQGDTPTDSDIEVSTSAGITGLSGYSSQQFSSVAPLNYDPTQEVVISIRLVCDDLVRPLSPVQVMKRSNPTPAPVE